MAASSVEPGLQEYRRAVTARLPSQSSLTSPRSGLQWPSMPGTELHEAYASAHACCAPAPARPPQAAALRAAAASEPDCSLGRLLRLAEPQQLKACEEDAGECGVIARLGVVTINGGVRAGGGCEATALRPCA